jgi:hypothetical protein
VGWGMGGDPFIGALEGQNGHCTLRHVGALQSHDIAWRAQMERAAGSVRRNGNGHHEGHTRGEGFVRTLVSGAELDREGAGCGHMERMGASAHSADTAQG